MAAKRGHTPFIDEKKSKLHGDLKPPKLLFLSKP